MRRSGILAAPAAMALALFCYYIPSFLAGGAPEWLEELRPFLIADSVMLLVIALYQSWRAKSSGLSLAVVWVSFVVVLGLLLFPEPMANLLSNVLGGST